MAATDPAATQVGLCITCRHAEAVRTDKGSLFFRCGLSRTNPRFAKYPRLPVIRCDGREPPEEAPTL